MTDRRDPATQRSARPHVAFVGALRDAGLPVSLAESLDAGAGAGRRRPARPRAAARGATPPPLVKRAGAPRRRSTRSSTCGGPAAIGDGRPAAGDGDGRAGRRRAGRASTAATRCATSCATLLLAGDDEALRRLAREAVDAARPRRRRSPAGSRGSPTGCCGRSSPETLIAALLDAVLAGKERGGLAEKVARQTLTERIRQFEESSRPRSGAGSPRNAASSRSPADRGQAADRAGRLPARARATTSRSCAARSTRWPGGSRPGSTAQRRLGRARPARHPPHRARVAVDRRRAADHPPPARASRTSPSWWCSATSAARSPASRTSRCCWRYALREQFSKVRAFAFVDTCRRGDPLLRAAAPTSSTRCADVAARPTSSGSTGTATTATPSRCSPRVAGRDRAEDLAADPRRRAAPTTATRPAGARAAGRHGPARVLAQPRAAAPLGHRRLGARCATARSWRWSSAATLAQLERVRRGAVAGLTRTCPWVAYDSGSWAARSTRSTTATSWPRARSRACSPWTRSSSCRPASRGRRPASRSARPSTAT